MRLVIISHTPHYLSEAGLYAGWGPTVREIDRLAGLFTEVRHIAWVYPGPVPESFRSYTAGNVVLVPQMPSGGLSLPQKIGALFRAVRYVRTILAELRHADIVHVRAPASISLAAMLCLVFLRRPVYRWIKYAGNWRPEGPQPWSYRLQRFLLRNNLPRATVTVNGVWPGDRAHVISFNNPSLDETDVERGRLAAATKSIESGPLQIVFAGRLEEEKGARRVLEIGRMLRDGQVDFRMHFAGDGPDRDFLLEQIQAFGLFDQVQLHGWLSTEQLYEIFARAHLFLLPSSASEGWPKVISEAMAFGCVPVVSDVSSIPQILEKSQSGKAVPPRDLGAFFDAILYYHTHPEAWRQASSNGVRTAQNFTYAAYLDSVRRLCSTCWGLNL